MFRNRLLAAVLLLPLGAGAQSLVERADSVAVHRPNPLAGDPEAPLAGAKLFEQQCKGCHGDRGHGNGRPHTPPLNTPRVRKADPGVIYWILTNGSESMAMPSFSHLSDGRRWQLVSFLQQQQQHH